MNFDKDETIIIEARANLQTNFIVPVGGKLFLTSKRLVFTPDSITNIKTEDTKTIILNLASIQSVEKKKGDTQNLLSGSFRERLSVSSQGKSYIFQVWGVAEWLKSFQNAGVR